MPRPQKTGLDYFPLDVHLDDKFELIEAEFGLIGFGVIIKLLQKIYGENGYYINFDEEVALLFAKRIGLGGKVVSEIVEASVRRGIFDKIVYEKYRVLTSKGIQQRYFEAISRRAKIEVENRYLLINVDKKLINVCNNSVNVCNNSINVDNNSQSKVKESIVNKSKVKKSIVKKEKKFPHGNYAHVLLSEKEYASLVSTYGNADELITFLDEYIEMKGSYKANSHYLAIKKWVVDAVNERKDKVKKGVLNNFTQKEPDYEEVEDLIWQRQKNLKKHGGEKGNE